MAWGTFGASPGAPPNPGFAGASSREAGGIRRARRLAVLGTAAGLASGLGIQRRAAHAKMGPGGTGGGTGSDGQGKRPAVGAFTHAMAGAFAGGVSRVAVAPLDVVKIRMQVQVEPVLNGVAGGKYRGIVQCATTILKEEGARGLWAGTVPALFLWVPYTAIQFASLGEFRRRAREAGRDPTAPPWAFLGGAIAGASATVCTYPFDVMRTVLAAQGSPRVYHSLAQAATGIVRDRGVAGLYAGCGVTLIEIVPASAIQFGAYAALRNLATRGGVYGDGEIEPSRNGGGGERSKKMDEAGERRIDPATNAACGFGAGTVARLIIHPLDVVKKRFQVAGLARSLRYGERVAPAAYANFASAFGAILKKEGVAGFYKGLLPGVIKSAPASAITFAVYEATMVALSAMNAGER